MRYPRIFSGQHNWPLMHNEIDPDEITFGPGVAIPIRWIPLAKAALDPMGWDFDAVEWDWPRWGRRILVSMNREARIQRIVESATQEIGPVRGGPSVIDRDTEVPAEWARATELDWGSMRKSRDWPNG